MAYINVLVTGSSGHLGEALVLTLKERYGEPTSEVPCVVRGCDTVPSDYTNFVGDICDNRFVESMMKDVDVVFHSASLHKPHVATHPKKAFIDTNISGTLNLLEAATTISPSIPAFIFTSTTSVYGDALIPPRGEPAVWVTEETPIPVGPQKHLCRDFSIPCVILRTPRFFLEDDDDSVKKANYSAANLRVNESLYHRADLQDVVDAHIAAMRTLLPALPFPQRAGIQCRVRDTSGLSVAIKSESSNQEATTCFAIDNGLSAAASQVSPPTFRKYIISAPSPFLRTDLADLRVDAGEVLRRRCGAEVDLAFAARGWHLPQSIDRVYDCSRRV